MKRGRENRKEKRKEMKRKGEKRKGCAMGCADIRIFSVTVRGR